MLKFLSFVNHKSFSVNFAIYDNRMTQQEPFQSVLDITIKFICVPLRNLWMKKSLISTLPGCAIPLGRLPI